MSLNNHVPIESISKMLGHSDISTTQIYARMLDQTVSEDMARMRAKFDTMPTEIKPLPERLLQNYLSKNKQKPELSQAEAFLFP